MSNQNLTHQYINVISTNLPAFGSYVFIDLNVPNFCIHEVVLQFALSGVSGIVGGSAALALPALAPAFKFIQNITITNNNNILDVIDGTANHLMNQLYTSLEDSLFINTSSGLFNNSLVRYNMSLVPNTYQVVIKSFFPQCRAEILNGNSSIRIAILLETLTNIVNQGALVGTPILTINSISALCKVTKYSNELVNSKLAQLSRNPLLKTYNTLVYQPYVIQANQSTCVIPLSNFVGQQIQAVYFIIRPSANINRAESFINQQLINYNVLSATGESICGGLITSAQGLYIYGRTMTLGNFLCDSTYGNVYSWYHSSDIISTLTQSAQVFGSRTYNGSEALVLNFALTAVPLNVDIYASVTSVYKQNPNASIIKLIV